MLFGAMKQSYLPLLFAAACLFIGCGEEGKPLPPGHPEQSPDQILVEPRIVIAEGGVIGTVISAKRIDIYERQNYAVLQDSVMVEFYNDQGEHTTTMTADVGEVWGLNNEEINSMVASGNVRVQSEERNASLSAPGIRWMAETDLIYGEGEVIIRTEDGYERGTGFVAKDDLTEYEFTGPIYGEFSGDEIPDIEEP